MSPNTSPGAAPTPSTGYTRRGRSAPRSWRSRSTPISRGSRTASNTSNKCTTTSAIAPACCTGTASRSSIGICPQKPCRAGELYSPTTRLGPLQFHVFERRRPRERVDLHQRRLLDPRPDAAGPEIVVDRREPGSLVQELLHPVQQFLAFRRVRFRQLLLIEPVDIRPSAIGEGARAGHVFCQAGRGVAVDGDRAETDAFQLLALEGRKERGPLHRSEF